MLAKKQVLNQKLRPNKDLDKKVCPQKMITKVTLIWFQNILVLRKLWSRNLFVPKNVQYNIDFGQKAILVRKS